MTVPSHPSSVPRVRDAVRSFAARLGAWALGEPAVVLPKRDADRLSVFEQRERLRRAERDGDQATLDRELEKVQLTEADLARLSLRNTPLAEWPDEDVDAMFGPPTE